MAQLSDNLTGQNVTDQNEATYDSLISLIENNQEKLSLILVACDDLPLRQRMIERYEREALQAKIRPLRLILGTEPSLRAGLEKLGLRQGELAVVTVTGAEWLLRVKVQESAEQSDLDKFFGYLQWTREGLREFQLPIVLWVTHRILREMSRKAPDFWSWRKAVLRFAGEEVTPEPRTGDLQPQVSHNEPHDKFLPPLEELLSEIYTLESTAPNSVGLATLYGKLGQVYAQRIQRGKTNNLIEERQQAIEAFEKAINRYQELSLSSAFCSVLSELGSFLYSQSLYEEALSAYERGLRMSSEIGDRFGEAIFLNDLGDIYFALGQYRQALNFYQQSLNINLEIGDRSGEANSLNGLGNVYYGLSQYQQALDFHQQALEVFREIDNGFNEANSLNNLGNVYRMIGQCQKAVDFHQQALTKRREIGSYAGESISLHNLGDAYFGLGESQQALYFSRQALEMFQKIGDRHGESTSLNGLGLIYSSLGQYQQALDFSQQALKIFQEIGDRHGESTSLNGLGLIYSSLGQYQRALDFYQQSLTIKREIGNRSGEARTLSNIGNAYSSLGQYQQAIVQHQQALKIRREIGNRYGEAETLFNKAIVLSKYEPQRFEALTNFQQAREIYTEFNLNHKVEECDQAIYNFNQTIATEQQRSSPSIPVAPPIGNPCPPDNWVERNLPKKSESKPASRKLFNLILWFGIGLAIVLVIAWLRK
jgi:tetratricopeptide (TPR) repeat protein